MWLVGLLQVSLNIASKFTEMQEQFPFGTLSILEALAPQIASFFHTLYSTITVVSEPHSCTMAEGTHHAQHRQCPH